MTRIQNEIQQKLQIERQVLACQLQNVNDQETSEPASPVKFQMHTKMQMRLASIERAIVRLEKGTFGVCQSCGEKIDGARLEALPYAEQCIDCQRKLERKIVHGYAHAYPVH